MQWRHWPRQQRGYAMAILTVGSGQQFTTLKAAVAAAHTGDTIDVQAGTYTNDFPGYVNGLTIEGVGGQVNLVATQSPPNGKAILAVSGNTVLKNLDLSGAGVTDGNGAGVRYEGGNLTVQNCSFHDNQDGLLGATDLNGTITIDHSEFYRNGTTSGFTHNMYIGDIQQFTLTNSYVHDANVGHEIKSRAENNTNSSTSSFSIDLPNGGNAAISGNTIEQGPNGQNGVMIAYGEEGALHTGTNVSFVGNTVVNDLTARTPYLFRDASGAPIATSGDTVYGLQANQLDANSSVSSSGFTFTSTRPTLSTISPLLIAKLVNDTGNSSADRITSNGGLTGTADANTGVTVQNGSTVLGTTTASATGQWSFAPASLADGSYMLTVSETDAAGNVNSAKVGFMLDTMPPGAPVITSAGSAPTSSAAQTLTGTAEANSTVTLYDNTTLLGTVVAGIDGSWTKSVTLTAQGTNSLTAAAMDVAGNTGPISAPVNYTLDTIPPAVTVTLVNDTGASLTDGSTRDDSLKGTGDTNATVTILNGTRVVTTTVADASGSWAVPKSSLNLADGSYKLTASETDAAGNTGTASIAFNLDTMAPSPVITNIVKNSNGTVTLSGVSELNSKVMLSDTVGADVASVAVGTTTASSTGAWSVTSTAPINASSINSYTASATDLAGNTGGTVGKFLVSSTASETLTGATGQSDVFAFLPSFGKDFVSGFETTAAAAANHDYVDLSRSKYISFTQLQSHITQGKSGAVIAVDGSNSITLTGIVASTLQASDFQFS